MEHSKQKTILIAEDDEDDRLFINKALSEFKEKYAVEFVDNGIDLINHLDDGNKYKKNSSKLPQLVLLDLNMPLKDGRESLREIRSNPKTKMVPVVVLTTSSDPEDVELCYRLGADGFVTKPDRFEELKRCIANIVNYWCETVRHPVVRLL
jgi:CheY-like chemotaxis protein